MTEYIPQGSASGRYEAARKALARYDVPDILHSIVADDLADALRALITPPSVGESEERIAERIIQKVPSSLIQMDGSLRFEPEALVSLVTAAVRAGIQDAHETWEPEVAMQPTQEQMLRWLGLDYDESFDDEGEPALHIYSQFIEREEF